MPDFRLAFRPFREQVAFFERKVNVPSTRWDDIRLGDHAHGFMVAGATRAALLDDFRNAILRAIKEGRGFADWQRDFESIVAKHGWSGWTGEGSAAGRAWRAKVIYQTNIRQSYNAGRYAQLTRPEMLAVRPWWEYRHGERGYSKNPRPIHQSWNGLVLHYSDPWWKTHYPMNGWGCNCGVRAHGEADLKRLGLKKGTAPGGGLEGVDPGFEYNVGEAARSLPAATSLGQKIMQLPREWRDRALADAMTRPVHWAGEYEAMVDAAIAESKAGLPMPRGRALPAGFLPPGVADRLPVTPSTAMMGVVDARIYHAIRASKGTPDDELVAALRELPVRMQQAETAVVWDEGMKGQRNAHPALIYAWELPSGRWFRAIFHLENSDGDRSMRKARMLANWLRTVGVVTRENLADGKYTLLSGRL